MFDTLNNSTVSESFDDSIFRADSSTPDIDSLRWPAKWRNAKIAEIQQLSNLPPNWDSYGGRSADSRSLNSAVNRVQALALETTVEPRVACLPSGNVMLAWESDDNSRACELEFLPNGMIAVLFADDNQPEMEFEGTVLGLGRILHWIPGTGR